MTLANFQSAVAHLIRAHSGVRPPDWRARLAAIDLDADERASIEVLALDDELNAYGREQAEQRWSMVERKIFRTLSVLDGDSLYAWWEQEFDPQHPTLESDASSSRASYTLAFLEHLEAAPPAWMPADARACLPDLMALERAEIELAQLVFAELPLIENAVVVHGAWRLVSLAHDIPEWIEACSEASGDNTGAHDEGDSSDGMEQERARSGVAVTDASLGQAIEVAEDVLALAEGETGELSEEPRRPRPRARDMTFVVVRSKGGAVPRLYEVDEAVHAFLLWQLGRGAPCAATPEVMGDLAALGLLERASA